MILKLERGNNNNNLLLIVRNFKIESLKIYKKISDFLMELNNTFKD